MITNIILVDYVSRLFSLSVFCVHCAHIFFLITYVVNSPSEIDLPYFTTEITTPSSPFAIALAKHLNAIGAKMYGAFWCSHCVEQKQVLFPF